MTWEKVDEYYKENEGGKAKYKKGRLHSHKVHALIMMLRVSAVVALGERDSEGCEGDSDGAGVFCFSVWCWLHRCAYLVKIH